MMGPRVSFFRLAQSSQPTQVLVRNKRHLVRRKKVREYDGDYTKKLGWVAPRGGGRKKGVKETKELLSLLSPVWHKKVTGNFSSYPLFFSPFLPGKEINISFLPFLWSFLFFLVVTFDELVASREAFENVVHFPFCFLCSLTCGLRIVVQGRFMRRIIV